MQYLKNGDTLAARNVGVIALLLAVVAVPLALAAPKDYPGMAAGKDHPAFSRFSGAVLLNQKTVPYAAMPFALGNIIVDAKSRDFQPEKFESLEGKISSFFYLAPDSTASLEVYRNYQSALAGAGFTVLYSCQNKQCGGGSSHGIYYNGLIKFANSPNANNAFVSAQDCYYLGAKKSVAGRDTYVMVMMGSYPSSFDGRAGILQVVIEPKPAKLGAVQINAAGLAQAIGNEGKVALYGLYFDTGRAVIKPESTLQLDEISKFLQSNASLNVIVVGHTDSQGSLEHNMVLSQQRADSVLQALTAQYKINPSRLLAKGAGSIAPVASNRSEEGRARNRRVEIVER